MAPPKSATAVEDTTSASELKRILRHYGLSDIGSKPVLMARVSLRQIDWPAGPEKQLSRWFEKGMRRAALVQECGRLGTPPSLDTNVPELRNMILRREKEKARAGIGSNLIKRRFEALTS